MGRRATLLSAATAAAMALGGLSLATAGPANAYTDGSWKVSCTVSHSAADDPIVLPNRPGASHLHDFFGNASLNAFSTYESMQGVRSTCPNQDRSSYWVPALYQNGRKVNPAGVTVYYVSPVTDQSTIEAFPPNFRMIAGNAKNADPAKMSGHIQWGCLGNTQIGRVVPAACPDADGIQARITFPSCWNGVWAPNGGDNAVNMRFPSRNACPAGFGRVLPTMRMNVAYLLGKTTGTVTLASGGWPSIHADFFNGWDQPTLEGLVKRCLHGKIDCQHFKGSTPGRAPAAQPQPPAGPKRAGAGKPAPVTAARPAGGSPAPAPADPPAPVSPSDPGVAPGAVAPAVPAGAVPAPAGPASGAEPPVEAQADSTVVLDAAPEDAQRRSTAAGRWHLVSAEGALNVPVAAGGTLLVLAFLMSCGLLVRAAVRRRQTHPVAGGSPPFGRPAAGRR